VLRQPVETTPESGPKVRALASVAKGQRSRRRPATSRYDGCAVLPSIGWAALAFERGFPAITLDVHFQDRGVVHEPVDSRQRHGLVGEDLSPFAEGLIGRDQQGSAFIAGGDQLEQHTGLGLILGDVGDIVEDQQLVLVELGDGGEVAAPAIRL
jgi:hypothetical protein